MKWDKKIVQTGNSLCFIIPNELLKYMELSEGNTVEIQDDKGKHGKFVSFWKKG